MRLIKTKYTFLGHRVYRDNEENYYVWGNLDKRFVSLDEKDVENQFF